MSELILGCHDCMERHSILPMLMVLNLICDCKCHKTKVTEGSS